MCVSPSFVWVEKGPKHEKVQVPCKVCWRCRSNRINDYVGRCLAEADSSDACAVLTLTYRPDKDVNGFSLPRRADLADAIVTKEHFQLFMKRMRSRGRRHGFSTRYIVAGECGSLKGRVHFHAVLFFKKTRPDAVLPDWAQRQRIHIPEWEHGHIFVDWKCDEKSIRYVCKYLLKEQDRPGVNVRYDTWSRWFSCSKKPVLGHAFFEKKAAAHAAAGVWPRTFEYQPPGGTRGRSYLMTGATRRDFLKRLFQLFGHWPKLTQLSEWVRKGVEKVQRLLLMEEKDHTEQGFDEDFAARVEQSAVWRRVEQKYQALDKNEKQAAILERARSIFGRSWFYDPEYKEGLKWLDDHGHGAQPRLVPT